MSIIQEALKKVDKKNVSEQATETIASNEQSKPLFKPEPVVIVAGSSSVRSRRGFIVALVAALIVAGASIFMSVSNNERAFGSAMPKTHEVAVVPEVASAPDAGIARTITEIMGPRTAALAPDTVALSSKKGAVQYQLNGIMYLESGSKAIVDNVIVVEGDKINGATIKKINKKSVVMDSGGNDIELELR